MKKLYDLDTEEVSLVDKAANKKKFLIFKSREGNEMKKTTALEMKNLMDSADPLAIKKLEAVVKSYGVAKDAGDMPPKGDSSVYKEGMESPGDKGGISERGQAALKAMGRIAAPFKDELTHDHVKGAMDAVGIGGGKEAPKHDETKGYMAQPSDVKEEHHVEAMKSAHKAYGEHLEKMGYKKYPDEEVAMKAKAKDHLESEGDDENETEEEEVGKSAVSKSDLDLSAFPKEQRPQLEAIFKSFDSRTKELVQKNEDLKKEIDARDDREKEREFVTKAESFEHLGLEKSEIVETLRDAAKLGPKSYDRVVKQYTAMNEQSRAGGLFKEIGSRTSGGGTSAEAKLDALVDSMVMKSGGDQTREQIYDQVIQTKEGKRLLSEQMTQHLAKRGN